MIINGTEVLSLHLESVDKMYFIVGDENDKYAVHLDYLDQNQRRVAETLISVLLKAKMPEGESYDI